MAKKNDQTLLARKFAQNWHLDIKDRQELSGGVLDGDLLCAVIVEILDKHRWYPTIWNPHLDYQGGLIQKTSSGCRIHWKGEVSHNRYALVEIEEYESVEEGVRSFAMRFFRNEFDGIEIVWSSKK